MKLGYGGTKEEMVRLINDSGILNEKIEDLDNVTFDQMIQAIHQIQDNLNITGTTAEEAEKTIQGSSNAMKAAWQNLLTGMADENADFDKLIQDFIGSLGTFLENMIPRIKTTIQGMGDAITALSSQLLPDLTASLVEELPGFMTAIGDLFRGIGDAILTALPTISEAGLEILTTILQDMVNALPEIVDIVLTILEQVYQTLGDAVPKILEAVGEVLPKIVEKISEHLPKMVESLGKVLVGVVDVLPKVLDALIKELPNMINAISNAILKSSTALIKVVTEMINILTKALPDILKMILTVLPDLFSSLQKAIIDNLPEIMDAVTEMLTAAIEALPEILNLVSSDAMAEIIKALVDFIIQSAPLMAETTELLFMELVKALIKIGKVLIKQLPSLIQNFMGGLRQLLPKLIAFGLEILGKVTAYFLNMINLARQKALEFVTGIVEKITELPGKIEALLTTVIEKVTTWASSFVEKAKAAGKDFLDGVVSKIKSLGEKIGSHLSSALSKVGEWASSMASKGKEGASHFVENLTSGLSGIADKTKSVGTNIVHGIWEGMSSSMKWIKDKISGWVDDVLDYLKKVFKIGSPSKLMAEEIGQWLPPGMAEGFDQAMPEAEEQMQKAINGAVRSLKADVSVSSGNMAGSALAGAFGTNSGYFGRNQTINFNQTINSPKAVDRLSIYKDTNNLLFTAKVGLSNV